MNRSMAHFEACLGTANVECRNECAQSPNGVIFHGQYRLALGVQSEIFDHHGAHDVLVEKSLAEYLLTLAAMSKM